MISHFWEGVQFTNNATTRQSHQSLLDYAERFRTNIIQYSFKEQELRVLEELETRLPTFMKDPAFHCKWWKTDGLNWLASLAIMMLVERDIDVLFPTKLGDQNKISLTIPRTVFGAAPETRILPLEFVPRRKLKPAFYRW
jgi:hypothetical protein